MNFEPTDDRRMLADTLDRFIADQYSLEHRNAIAYDQTGFSRDLWARFAELGAIGALFPEADGGFGGEGFDISVVFQSLGKGLVPEPFLGALVVGRAIGLAGSEAQKARIAELIEGNVIAAFAHDELGNAPSLTHLDTQAERDGQGWVLRGAKGVVAHGGEADLLLVSARTAGQAGQEAGISLFLVPGNADGVSRRSHPNVDGGRSAEITFDGVRLDDAALLGEAGAAYAVLEQVIGIGVLAVCAEALGAMDVAKDDTLEYLRTRKQFDVPIGSFQALQHRMADVLLEIEQARSAVINAAAALGSERLVREQALSAAKYTIGRIGIRVAEETIQLHGGIGMTWELPLPHYAKRLVMIDHQFGDEDHHLARYMALSAQADA